jgi:hypothetical protein
VDHVRRHEKHDQCETAREQQVVREFTI